MVVYLDLLFLLNLVANDLLLMITARIGGKPIRRWLFGFSAALGAGYAALPFLGIVWLSHPACKVCMGILMAVIAFGSGPGLLKSILVFFGASAALGGMVWAAELLGGRGLTLEHGVLYSWVDIRLLLLLLILCYGILTVAADRAFLHKHKELVPLTLTANGRTVKLTALVDTGNTLTDPVSNTPVVVAEASACRPLLPLDLPLDRPIEAMELLAASGISGFRLIPYRAVGVESGLLLALRAEVTIGTRKKMSLVALSPTPVSDGGGYQALIGGTS